jgi:hypothetical protein
LFLIGQLKKYTLLWKPLAFDKAEKDTILKLKYYLTLNLISGLFVLDTSWDVFWTRNMGQGNEVVYTSQVSDCLLPSPTLNKDVIYTCSLNVCPLSSEGSDCIFIQCPDWAHSL